MNAAYALAALDRFVAALEARLQRAIAPIQPDCTLRCRLQQGRLLVLAEERRVAVTARDREARFSTIIDALQTELPKPALPEGFLNEDGTLSVRLYLRQLGMASPYAAKGWQWQPVEMVPPTPADTEAETIPAATETSASEPEPEPTGALVVLSSPAEAEPFAPPEIDGMAAEPRETSSLSWLWQRWADMTATWQDWPWRSVAGLTVVGVLVGGLAYGISRPCLVGSCDRRQTARDLSQTAMTELATTPTLEDVRYAHADLQRAVQLVSAIPPWSPHYDTAQTELARYRTQLADLERIMSAQRHATAASEKSQDPPHPVPQWVEVHLLWQKAIADLRRVPEQSPVAALAAEKLEEYAANYAAIGQRLTLEERAEASLNLALQVGQVATSRTEAAATLSEWMLAQQEWQRAINALNRIPETTLAYDEARSLLSAYHAELTRVRNRVTFERAGERAFQAGLENAAAARTAERNDQWTQAVDQWRRANAQLRQVPEDSLRHADVQAQLATYQAALENAETRLRQAVALQTLDTDLEALCSEGQAICTFTFTAQQIDLTLIAPYDSALRQSISPPSPQNQSVQATAVVEETHQLIQDIMRLGNQVEIPIFLYDEDQRFIARYQPEYGGFVKEQ